MAELPRTAGPLTLVRALGAGGVAECYEGTLDTDGGKRVLVRRLLPFVLRDASRLQATEARVRDLLGVRHPSLVAVVDWVSDGPERYIVEEWTEGVDLERLIEAARAAKKPVPPHVFLNLATQACNGLEALHGRPGKASGSDNVLHLGMCPAAVTVTKDARVALGSYGLARSPTTLPHSTSGNAVRMEYLSPEQTHPDQKLAPSSDIFSLGTVLYELFVGEPLFRSESNLQTIHKVRRAEVTTEMLRVKERMPGLEKILFRALSLNPRHRYQRAFVLREDLRGLMAGFQFNTVTEDTVAFLAPVFATAAAGGSAAEARETLRDPLVGGAPVLPPDSFEDAPPTRIDPDPLKTAARASKGRAERAGVAAGLTAVPDEPDAASKDRPTVPFPDELDRPTAVSPGGTPHHPDEDTRASSSEAGLVSKGPPATPKPTALPAQAAPPKPAAPPAQSAPPKPPPPKSEAEPDSTRGFIAAKKNEAKAPSPPSGSVGNTILPPEDVAPPARIAASALAASGANSSSSGAPVEPDSTRGFMAGQAQSRPAPPPVEPAKTAEPPTGFTRNVPPPRKKSDGPSAPVQPAAVKPAPQAPPVAVSPPPQAAPKPASSPKTPPAPKAPLAPKARPAPVPGPSEDEFTDLDAPARGRGGLLIAVAAAVALLVIVCAVGTYALLGLVPKMLGGSAEDVADAAGDEAADEAGNVGGDVLAEPNDAEATGSDASAPAGDAAADLASADEPAVEPPAASEAPSGSSRASSSPSSSRSSSSDDEWMSPLGSSAPSRGVRPGSGSSSSSSSISNDAIVDASLDAPEEDASNTIAALDQYAPSASKGKLTSSDVMVLEMVEEEDPAYSRSRALLLMNAQRKGDPDGTKRYLDQLMQLPENHYNPAYLSDLGRWYCNAGRYQDALDNAELAERYWARLPPELVFSKKAEIYEVQASSYQGLFYKSEDDMELLESAIHQWEKYRSHVQTRSRSDLTRRADKEISKLNDIRRRLQ